MDGIIEKGRREAERDAIWLLVIAAGVAAMLIALLVLMLA